MENNAINDLWFLPLDFIEKTENDKRLVYSDTDSVVGNSIIIVNGKPIKIEDFYNSLPNNYIEEKDHHFVKKSDGFVTLTVNDNHELIDKEIIYCMKHLVKKRFFRIKTDTNEVIITEDHSLMVKRNGYLIGIKVKELMEGDEIYEISESPTL
jgi:hypothetical protein